VPVLLLRLLLLLALRLLLILRLLWVELPVCVDVEDDDVKVCDDNVKVLTSRSLEKLAVVADTDDVMERVVPEVPPISAVLMELVEVLEDVLEMPVELLVDGHTVPSSCVLVLLRLLSIKVAVAVEVELDVTVVTELAVPVSVLDAVLAFDVVVIAELVVLVKLLEVVLAVDVMVVAELAVLDTVLLMVAGVDVVVVAEVAILERELEVVTVVLLVGDDVVDVDVLTDWTKLFATVPVVVDVVVDELEELPPVVNVDDVVELVDNVDE